MKNKLSYFKGMFFIIFFLTLLEWLRHPEASLDPHTTGIITLCILCMLFVDDFAYVLVIIIRSVIKKYGSEKNKA